MNKALKKARKRGLALILIELVLIIAAITMYLIKKPEPVVNIMTPEFWVSFLGGLLIIDFFAFWIFFIVISRLRKQSDLSAASLLGQDVQEAYNFGQLGLAVTDENGMVLWVNNLFRDRNLNILDTNIFELYPTLKDLVFGSNEMTVKVEAGSRTYQVKYLKEAQLFIFRDLTEYESIFDFSKQQAMVMGIIIIDNYSEIAGNAEDDNNDLVAKTRQIIFDYAKTHDVFLRRFRSDSYMAVCNFESLASMEEDGFSIMDEVKKLGKGNDIRPTLSIGFAHDFPDVNKLNEMASNALDIAMSRGGDQTVVSKYGEELKFFGGKTNALEVSSKVKVRSVADSLASLISNASNIIIMGHTDMDMDALGAALGVKAFCDWKNKPAKIVYEPKQTESKARYAIQTTFKKEVADELFVSSKESLALLKETSLVVVVDTSVPGMVVNPKLLEKASKIIVIDHHRRGESFIDKPVLSYIDTSASSVSEIMSEFLRFVTANPRIELSPEYATILLAGIFLDTNNFKSKTTGMRTFDAAEVLKTYGADNSIADSFLKDEFEEFSLITKIISSMQTPYYGVVYCASDDEDIIDRATIAKVANRVMELKGINACFVIGRTSEKEVRMSARSDGTVNVQLLCEKLGGGGIYSSSAASFKEGDTKKAIALLNETLDEYLSSARSGTAKGE